MPCETTTAACAAIPAEHRRKGCVSVVKGQRRQVVPGRIVAEAVSPDPIRTSTETAATETATPGPERPQKDSQKAGFKQQQIPLVRHENLPRRNNRQIVNKQHHEDAPLPYAVRSREDRDSATAPRRPRRSRAERNRCCAHQKMVGQPPLRLAAQRPRRHTQINAIRAEFRSTRSARAPACRTTRTRSDK